MSRSWGRGADGAAWGLSPTVADSGGGLLRGPSAAGRATPRRHPAAHAVRLGAVDGSTLERGGQPHDIERLPLGHPRDGRHRPEELAGDPPRRQRVARRGRQPLARAQPRVRRRVPGRVSASDAPDGRRGLRRAASPLRRRRGLHPAPDRACARSGCSRPPRAGKHVLVEKPVGVTAEDVREMLAACDRHRVQLMDGVMFMHSRRLAALRRTLDDGESVGDVRRIAAQFSFNGSDELRPRRHPHGQPARAARLPGRPRLVHDPLRAVGDEVRAADARHRPRAGRGRPAPSSAGTGPDRDVRRAALPRRRLGRLLLLVPDREPAVGERERHEGGRPRARLRAAVLRRGDAVRGHATRSSRSRAATSTCGAARGSSTSPSTATATPPPRR